MKRVTKGKSIYSYQQLQDEALKYKFHIDFRNNSPKHHKASYRLGILKEISIHMISSKHFWTNEELHEEALRYKTRKAFRNANDSAYCIGYRKGILDSMCLHMVKGKNGFDVNKEAYIYFYRIDGNILGYGITNDFKTRNEAHRGTAKKKLYQLDFLSKFKMSGVKARELEQMIKRKLPLADLSDFEGFKTENTHMKYYQYIVKEIIC